MKIYLLQMLTNLEWCLWISVFSSGHFGSVHPTYKGSALTAVARVQLQPAGLFSACRSLSLSHLCPIKARKKKRVPQKFGFFSLLSFSWKATYMLDDTDFTHTHNLYCQCNQSRIVHSMNESMEEIKSVCERMLCVLCLIRWFSRRLNKWAARITLVSSLNTKAHAWAVWIKRGNTLMVLIVILFQSCTWITFVVKLKKRKVKVHFTFRLFVVGSFVWSW